MGQVGGLRSNQQNYQQCFIGHSQGASWRETFEQVCEEVLPKFDLKPWYADKHYQGSVPLRQKVVNMIATTRYGIYDLSYWRENDQSPWIMPRNVLIELGMAIALNRPMLLLRHRKNRECGLALPACLEGVDIGEFGDGKKLLRETLKACLPSLTQRTPKQDWLNRYCHFGDLECSYREVHPQAQQWGRQKIHIHVSDGANAAHIDCSDFRDMIEEDVIYRFNDLEFNYLDSPTCPQRCKFLLCSHCQEVRSSPFAIYRITPHTSADTFIAIGMSIALEKQFNYAITKILIIDDKNNIPSLLEGYEIIVERNYARIKDRLNLILPEMIEKTRQTAWKPQPLPFEVSLPTKEYTEPEETTSTEVYSENDTQAQRDEDSSNISTTGSPPSRINVFISYSHKDQKYLSELRVHLAAYERIGMINFWDDTQIQLGTKWREEINKALQSAKMAILLISPDFLASDFIATNELPPLLVAAEKEGATILPVILKPSIFMDTSLAQFPTVNMLSSPLSELVRGRRDKFWSRVAGLVRDTLNRALGKQETEKDQDIDQMGQEQTRDRLDKDRFDKFTERARKVLSLAQEEAQRLQHEYIGTEDLLLGLVREGEGVAAKVLANFGVELNKVRSAVESIIGRGDRIVSGEIGLTPRAKKVVDLAVDEARRWNHHYIGTEHLLLGLLREGEGIGAGVLESIGINLEEVRSQIIRVLSQGSIPATVGKRDEDISLQREAEGGERNNDGHFSTILTPTEMQVLRVLMRSPGQVVNRDQLLTEVWNDEENNSNIVDVYIRRLRRKLEADPDKPQHIISIRGVGYKFVGGLDATSQRAFYHSPVTLCQRLEKHLKPLERDGLLEIEHGSKTKIHSMEDYDIMLHNSKFLLPLISPDYMISESSIVNHFIEEYMQDEADVIPIILRPTDWKNTPFAHLKSLPTNGVPVTQWPSQDDAFEDVALNIRRVLENLQNRP